MKSNDVNELIQEIIRHEVSLEKMYKRFAKSHPNHRQFWSQIAREEAMHVKMIENKFSAGSGRKKTPQGATATHRAGKRHII